MVPRHSLAITSLFLALLFNGPAAFPQAADNARATLKGLHVEGIQHVTEPQVISLSGLSIGTALGKTELQAAADRLVQTGLFSSVNYAFQNRNDGLYLTFKLAEAPRISAYFDNIPWFTEAELSDAIRKVLPFYDGTLPEAGAAVEQTAGALSDLLASRGTHTAVEHQVIANPLGEGTVQEYRIADAAPLIAKIEFGDPALASSKVVQQHLGEIAGKTYSRMTIDLFLAEQVKPIYLQQGFLRAKLGPPEIRLTGNPNQKLPDRVAVFVPVSAGTVYRYKGAQWNGNTLLSNFTLNDLIGIKPEAVADGMAIEAAWTRAEEEYGRRGYLDAKVEPAATYDEQGHTVSYRVNIHEGRQYKFGKMVLTGISPAAERRLRTAWPIVPGDIFDKIKYEEILLKLQTHPDQVFGDLPLHYDSVGHWLEADAASGTLDVLLDFK